MSSCGVGRRGMQAEGRLGIAVTARQSLLRRGFEKLGEGAAAEVQGVLVRHDDLQPVLARLLDLLGQPLIGDEAVLVEVEKHVRRVGRPSIGGGDREAVKGVGDLVGQLQCARVGRRGPERTPFGKNERLALRLARHVEREGGLVQKVGRAEEHRLGCFKWSRSGERDCEAAGCGPRRLGDDFE